MITLQRAIEGFNLHLAAEGRSPHTVRDYNITLARFVERLGPLTRLDTITPDQVRGFLKHWSEVDVKPAGAADRPARKLAKKTILNMHIALSALWTWAVAEGFAEAHVLQGRIQAPRVQRQPIDALTDRQVKALASVVNGNARAKAILFFMLSTGVRASELCGLRIGDVDLKARTATVTGKGDKTRIVPFGDKTAAMLFRYIALRPETRLDEPVFLSTRGGPLTRTALLLLIRRAGERAEIRDLYPHRLRRTFAVDYIRNGGDGFTLQRILGHSSMEMVRRYLDFAGADVQAAHRRADPVDNLL